MERMLTRKQAAKELNISVATLDTARQNGQIAYVRYSPRGTIYFTVENLQEYVARCTHRIRSAPSNNRYSPKTRHKSSTATSLQRANKSGTT